MSQQINLFNPIFLQQEKQFSATTMAQGLGVISIAVLAFAGFSSWQAAQVQKDAAAASTALKATQEKLIQVVDKTKPVPPNKQIEEDIQIAETRLRGSQQILNFVQNGEFKSGQAYSSYLRAFARRTMPGVWLTGLVLGEGGNEIEIAGRAWSPVLVPAYIKSLKTETAFVGKSFGSMVLRTPVLEGGQKSSVETTKASPTVPYVDFLLNSSEATQVASVAIGTGIK